MTTDPAGAPTAVARATAIHTERWGSPDLVVRSPGRVNLIGEHTDYNDGFTLPMALPFEVALAFSSRPDGVQLWSEGFGDLVIDPDADPRDTADWAKQITGVVHLLGTDHQIDVSGWAATVTTDIPTGASVSSSAAIETAVAIALLARAGQSWPAVELARLGQRVENEVVGIPTGIMDQLIVAGAVDGHASLMDCRSLELQPVELPESAVVVLMDTRTRRVLADAAYGDRRAACERAAADIGVDALRDASLGDLEAVTDETDRRRAHHVITENERAVTMADVLANGDPVSAGALMSESHRSLRDDFEVSGDGLDAIVAVADTGPGCFGARMTGGGFAGCAVALVEAEQADAFVQHVLDNYDYDGLEARVWVCQPSAGAGLVE